MLRLLFFLASLKVSWGNFGSIETEVWVFNRREIIYLSQASETPDTDSEPSYDIMGPSTTHFGRLIVKKYSPTRRNIQIESK